MLEVVRYFSKHYGELISIPVMAEQLQIQLEQIELAFDHHRQTTTTQALLEYRLNRLCDEMSEHPCGAINEQVHHCGLGSVPSTNNAFEQCFGIDLQDFHQQCSLAAANRPVPYTADERVSDRSNRATTETRFHRHRA